MNQTEKLVLTTEIKIRKKNLKVEIENTKQKIESKLANKTILTTRTET